MGIEFRGSHYKKDVSFGKRTIKDGEAVAIWNRLGVHRQVIGPRLTRLFFSTILFLDKRVAGPNEYLVVKLIDGTVNHLRGPIVLYENPVYHISVEVKTAYSLTSASECIVVSREIRLNSSTEKTLISDSRIERVLIRGPYLFFPLVGDTIVSFEWHGTPLGSSNYSISPSIQKFTILNTASRQWKVDVPFLPPQNNSQNISTTNKQNYLETKPGTLQLSFNFCLQDVNQMLDNTKDVIGDLYDALVIDLTDIKIANMRSTTASLHETEEHPSSSSFSSASSSSTSASWMIKTFSSIHAFPNLLSRSQVIGVAIEGVAFRGYEQNNETKKQLSEFREIEIRLTRERMIAEQDQIKIETDLVARRARLEQEKNLQQATLAVKKETLQAEQDYREAELKHKIEQERIQLESDLERNRALNDETLRVLSEMSKIGVDLTALLCQYPEKKKMAKENESFPITIAGQALVEKTPAFSLFGV
jgi:hypothetical protein